MSAACASVGMATAATSIMSASFLFMFSFLVLLRPNSRFQSSDFTSMLSNHVMLSGIVQRPGTDRKSWAQGGPLA